MTNGLVGGIGSRLRRLASLGLNRDNRFMFLAVVCNEAAVGAHMALWPLFLTALGATPVEIGGVIGASGGVFLFAVLLGGWLSDRVSSRWLLVGARVSAMVGVFTASLASVWWHTAPARCLISGSGLGWPVAAKVISANVANERERGHAFTVIYTIGPSTAMLITPALGGYLAQQYGIPVALQFAAIVLIASTICFYLVRPQPPTPHDQPRATYRQALAYPAVRRLAILTVATGITLQIANAFLPKFLQDVHHVPIAEIGLFDSVKAAGASLIGIVASRLRLTNQPLVAVSWALGSVAVGLGLLAIGDAFQWWLTAYLLTGGVWLIFSSFYAAMGVTAPEAVRGRAFAFVELGIGAGSAVGPFLAGFLYTIDPRGPIYAALTAAAMLLVALIWSIRANGVDSASAPN